MSADFSLLLMAGVLCACGVYLLLERAVVKILLGVMLMSNGVNLLLLAAGGRPGSPPIRGREVAGRIGQSDTLAQAMILTSIVITAGVGAFILALAYRSYRFTTVDELADDAEDAKVAARAPDPDTESESESGGDGNAERDGAGDAGPDSRPVIRDVGHDDPTHGGDRR